MQLIVTRVFILVIISVLHFTYQIYKALRKHVFHRNTTSLQYLHMQWILTRK